MPVCSDDDRNVKGLDELAQSSQHFDIGFKQLRFGIKVGKEVARDDTDWA